MAKYTDHKLLGRGGFGEVYECARDSDGEHLAKKKLSLTATPDDVERFLKEVAGYGP